MYGVRGMPQWTFLTPGRSALTNVGIVSAVVHITYLDTDALSTLALDASALIKPPMRPPSMHPP
jgi:hypothetical protein